MREIKFRAWDKNKKRLCAVVGMSSGVDIKGTGGWFIKMGCWRPVMETDGFGGHPEVVAIGDQYRLNPSDHILMQYTGLKDSYATEEYFDYIIEEEDGTKRIIEDGCSAVLFRNPHVTFDIKYFWELKQHRVIGNIYENPELVGIKSE